MKRSELISSREYWITEIQLNLFKLIENYKTKYHLTRTQIAAKLGVTKGYITQVLNGDFDHKISKLVDLSLAFGKVPMVHFVDLDQYIQDDANNNLHIYKEGFKPIQYNIYLNTSSSEVLKNYLPPSDKQIPAPPYLLKTEVMYNSGN
ncbi:MAG TPA: helix-turn-helix transcriptional regulator [Chitinophagaceae bacterium]|nr:helix-turn-helix transcriptional regulator [Chitinophagaceae bacterium]